MLRRVFLALSLLCWSGSRAGRAPSSMPPAAAWRCRSRSRVCFLPDRRPPFCWRPWHPI